MKLHNLSSLLLSLIAVAPSAIVATDNNNESRELVAATSDGTVCSNDYQLTHVIGDTLVDRPIEIIEQNGDSVKFKVHQIWSPFGADSVFVGYKGATIGEHDCDEFADVGEFDDITITATCSHNQPQTVVDIFVVDNSVNGDAPIPKCCHSGNAPSGNVVHYTYLVQCSPTCTGPNPNSDPDCPEVVLDFNDLPEYSYVHDEYWYKYGVKITAKSKSTASDKRYTPLPKDDQFPIGSDWADRYGFTENNPNSRSDDEWEDLHNQAGGAARVFNTQKPDGNRGNPKCSGNDGDRDLGSPNKSCPNGTPGKTGAGPANGWGGRPNSSRGWPNCPSKLIGNVLIIQEDRKSCPDDTSRGGWITFDFNPNIAGDVEFTYAQILDTDNNNTPKISVWKTGEDTSKSPSTNVYTTAATGENGLFYKRFDNDNTWKNRYKGLKRVQIEYHESGSIAEIRFKPSKCPAP